MRPTLDDAGLILVAEDEGFIRRLILKILRAKGLRAIGVVSGDELWQTWSKAPGAVVLSDVKMPGTMDGIDACLAIRKADPGARVFVMSGDESQMDRAASQGLPLAFKKPFDVPQVEAWIETL